MKSRQAETQRFPLIPLSVSDWLIRKHHPIREEQTVWHTEFFDTFLSLALQVLDGIQAEITTLKHKMENKDPENEDPSCANNKCD